MPRRWLNQPEYELAWQVFRHTIPYQQIRITDQLGLGARPYTLYYPEGGPSPVMSGSDSDDFWHSPRRPSSDQFYDERWHVNVGAAGFAGMQNGLGLSATLIHELTHVWQSCHSVFPDAYIFNSLWHQAVKGSRAYDYAAGAEWRTYNAEQQAQIVEDWFSRGQQSNDPNYRYVNDNIRTAKPMPGWGHAR